MKFSLLIACISLTGLKARRFTNDGFNLWHKVIHEFTVDQQDEFEICMKENIIPNVSEADCQTCLSSCTAADKNTDRVSYFQGWRKVLKLVRKKILFHQPLHSRASLRSAHGTYRISAAQQRIKKPGFFGKFCDGLAFQLVIFDADPKTLLVSGRENKKLVFSLRFF